MIPSPRREIDEDGRLDEQYVQDAFHSFLKFSLAQAMAERLLDISILSSAEGDLMITGTFRPHLTSEHLNPVIHNSAIIIRPRIMPLFRSNGLHHRSAFDPSSPRRRQSLGMVRILPST